MVERKSGFQWLKSAGPAAVLLVLGLIVLLATMNQALLNRLSELRSAPRDNVQWGLMQLQNEYSRFHLAVDDALHGTTGDKGEIEWTDASGQQGSATVLDVQKHAGDLSSFDIDVGYGPCYDIKPGLRLHPD